MLFEPLTQLDELYLSRNQLATLPEKLFEELPQLMYFDLSFNQLEKLPKSLFNLTQLKYLNYFYLEIIRSTYHYLF